MKTHFDRVLKEHTDIYIFVVEITFPRCDRRILHANKDEISEEDFLKTCREIRKGIFNDLCEY